MAAAAATAAATGDGRCEGEARAAVRLVGGLCCGGARCCTRESARGLCVKPRVGVWWSLLLLLMWRGTPPASGPRSKSRADALCASPRGLGAAAAMPPPVRRCSRLGVETCSCCTGGCGL